jgi:hypothetical protein
MAELKKNRSASPSRPLTCPSCARTYELSERFCKVCGMPLVYAGSDKLPPPSPERERALKVNPIYSKGEPVKVAFARNQAESDLVQNILLEEGIPSMARRTRGFDVPDFLAAGPRDVLVPESGADAARDVLRDAEVAETVDPAQPRDASTLSLRVVLAVLGGGALAAFLAWLLVQSSG